MHHRRVMGVGGGGCASMCGAPFDGWLAWAEGGLLAVLVLFPPFLPPSSRAWPARCPLALPHPHPTL
jgi:hypothetical protein